GLAATSTGGGNWRLRSKLNLSRGHHGPAGPRGMPPTGGFMASKDFIRQMKGYGLTTAKILYRMPDHPSFLQTYVWQDYDLAPQFPILLDFLDFWQRELAGPLHSVIVTHAHLIRPAEFRAVEGEITIH